ncbi:MAG: response regulator [Nitrospinae bacterium]|nr:response regulator [Nitrospinota bacterium]
MAHHVLLAEDSKIVLISTRSVLKQNGFEVTIAEDGQQAIDIIENSGITFDAIVSDLMMPNVDGFAFAKYNFERQIAPFIAYTSINDANTALRLMDLGVHDYVVKPFEVKSFIVTIKQAIKRWELHKEIEGKPEEVIPGNVATISIPTKKSSLSTVINWINRTLSPLFDKNEATKFISLFEEILLNAYEHGNLKITEEEKATLLCQGHFEERVEELERTCDAEIQVTTLKLQDKIVIRVADEGKGFNHGKFTNMTDEEILERLSNPNGRGIFMASRYFDAIDFSNNGATVTLTKKYS